MSAAAMRFVAALVLAGAALVAALPAHAHRASDAYLTLARDAGGWDGRVDVAVRDLDEALGLDADGDGAITWGELREAGPRVGAYVYGRLELSADGGEACPLVSGDLRVVDHGDGAYAALAFRAPCATQRGVAVDYRLLFDIDPTHRGLLRAELGGATQTAVLAPDRTRVVLDGGDWRATLGEYAREGVWHIWLGFDHVLFLVALLLPAVLSRERGRWREVASFRVALVDVAAVVTAFTVAHSLTLSLAVLGVVSVPARLVESVIAATVLAAALNNLWPVVSRRRALVAFVLGLVHGLGFANVLVELGLPRDALALALFAFNLGVEAGQLALVAAFLPLAWLLRGGWFYRRVALQAGSAAVALIATAWLLDRAL